VSFGGPCHFATFLAVAQDEGHTAAEYARRSGVPHSVMSRHLLDIGERNRHMEAGLNLVTFRPRLTNLREHEYMLTPTGRALAQKLVE
jgi:DNA-binding MarR family transcriptional regulator